MEIGDGMGPGSSVATNKLLQVCWRRQVCIGSFQWPRWSRERQAPCCYREGGCVLKSDGPLICMQGWVNNIQCAHWFPALAVACPHLWWGDELSPLVFFAVSPFFIFPVKNQSKPRVVPPHGLCVLPKSLHMTVSKRFGSICLCVALKWACTETHRLAQRTNSHLKIRTCVNNCNVYREQIQLEFELRLPL